MCAPCATTLRFSNSISSYPVTRLSSAPSFENVFATLVVNSSPRIRICFRASVVTSCIRSFKALNWSAFVTLVVASVAGSA